MAEALHCSNLWHEHKIMLGTQITPTMWGQLCLWWGWMLNQQLNTAWSQLHNLQLLLLSSLREEVPPSLRYVSSPFFLLDWTQKSLPTPDFLTLTELIFFQHSCCLLGAPSSQRFIRPNRLYPAVVGVVPDVYNPKNYITDTSFPWWMLTGLLPFCHFA